MPCLQAPKKQAISLLDNGGFFPLWCGAVSLSAKFKLTASWNKRRPATNRPLRTKQVNGLSYPPAKPPFRLNKSQSTDTQVEGGGRNKCNFFLGCGLFAYSDCAMALSRKSPVDHSLIWSHFWEFIVLTVERLFFFLKANCRDNKHTLPSQET